ncbi:hypothetical protein NUU61_005482 [Penicillium alfredii]|uniref:DUF7907 domain-containing protein n=1 Tax=Penicillium alfredii TaxID=1506179 RepID=A0A9W9F9K8_9EURO|nr:uncharacterized protein NUU61_005482 [Penicillium alfredii]KAJ5096126.1 hypothetical protein NUU61_005482 [Penicillium alfredii]
MKLLAAVSLLATAATASPVQKLFNLQTSGASNSSHNGLWLVSYHSAASGPLDSEPIFTKQAADAATFYLNNGTVRYDTPNQQNQAPWAIDLVTVQRGNGLKEPVRIGVHEDAGTKGFYINKDGLQGPSQTFGSWSICDNQLFFQNPQASDTTVPSNCDIVKLQAVYKTS